ncbi:MAG: class I SAM-dependent methyltransferase [Bdellovibrionota bacterium]
MIEQLQDRLKQLHTRPDARILDIGGWFAPCRQATHLVDIMPFETMNVAGAYGNGEMKIRKENYFQLDLGKVDRLPFKDKEFDFVVCRHTLEDIKDPIRVCQEMIRVAKSGYIETPHRAYESTKGVERHWWCGHYHHRWLVEIQGRKVVFQFKPHNLHSSSKFNFRCWPWQKVREEFKNTGLLWDGTFDFEERVIIDYGELKAQLAGYKKSFAGKRLRRLRWARD